MIATLKSHTHACREHMYFLCQCTLSALKGYGILDRPRRRMLHPRSEPQIFAVLHSLCKVVRLYVLQYTIIDPP